MTRSKSRAAKQSFGFGRESTHSLEQALAAQREGADYIGSSELPTPTKLTIRRSASRTSSSFTQEVNLADLLHGGINIDNLQTVIDAGAKRVVMVSALLSAQRR